MIRKIQILCCAGIFLLGLGSGAPAQETPSAPAGADRAAGIASSRRVADLVREATSLGERLASLQQQVKRVFDFSKAHTALEDHERKLENLAARLDGLQSLGAYGYNQLADLKEAIRAEAEILDAQVSVGLTAALTELDSYEKGWSEEKRRWEEWRDAVPANVPIESLEPTFQRAQTTIEAALGLLGETWEPMLGVQRRVGDLQAKLRTLSAQTEALLQSVRGDLLRKSSPSMVSPDYWAQLKPAAWADFGKGIASTQWPDRRFFQREGWVVGLQLIVALLLAAIIAQRRDLLETSDRWRFLSARPFATGCFVAVAALRPLHGPLPASWEFITRVAIGLAAARLVAVLSEMPWRRRFLYLIVLLSLVTETFRVFGLPTPLAQMFGALVAAAFLPLCLWRAAVNVRRKGPFWHIWALRGGAAVLAVVLIAEILGYTALAGRLLEGTVGTVFVGVTAWVLALLARGGVQFALGSSSPLSRASLIRRNARVIEKRADLWVNLLVGAFAVGMILRQWRVYDTWMEAVEGVLSIGITVGQRHITLGLLLGAVAILYGAYVTSWALQSLLMDEVYPRRRIAWGARISMNRLLHYCLVLLGFLFALSALGVDLRNITILAGALGIGIGFGLQNIVDNFVSGLILLFERPVKVGDVIQMGEQWGTIRKFGLRATVVETFDRSEIIVPNSQLVSNPVTNWTFTNAIARETVIVGVAYGSDVPLTMKILGEIADANPLVLKEPPPQVLFMEFGDSSLNFHLRTWLDDVEKKFQLRSELHQEIDRRFREANVEIAFPQRDLHLRTVDERAKRALTGVVRTAPAVGGGREEESQAAGEAEEGPRSGF